MDIAPVLVAEAQALPGGIQADPEYWHSLIDECEAGRFLGLQRRTMQTMRQRGDGPRWVSVSSRCVRYRRIDLKSWADDRLRKSTTDPGP